MTLPWRNCGASLTLVAEINARWPGRDKGSDGTIGDASHQSRASDHNLTVKVGALWVVRARDVDKDGVDAAMLVEYLRTLGARRDPRLYPNGYLIFNRRITNADFSGWHAYTGTNPHDHHFHVSFSTVPAGFDSPASWGIATAAGSATTTSAPPVAALTPTTLEDDLMASIPITPDVGGKFHHAAGVEAGGGSQVAAKGWVVVGSTFGGTTFTVAALSADGRVLGYWKDQRAQNNRSLAFQLPDGTRAVTCEGVADNAGTRPWASTYSLR